MTLFVFLKVPEVEAETSAEGDALQAIVETAHAAGVQRLYVLCHPDHRPSRRVLEKCDFQLKGTLRRHTGFPNLRRGVVLDVLCSASILGD